MKVTVALAVVAHASIIAQSMIEYAQANNWYVGARTDGTKTTYWTTGGSTYTIDTATGVLMFNGSRASFAVGCGWGGVDDKEIWLTWDTSTEVHSIPYASLRVESTLPAWCSLAQNPWACVYDIHAWLAEYAQLIAPPTDYELLSMQLDNKAA